MDNSMNENIKKIMEKADMPMWQDEAWGPGPGHVDWQGVDNKCFEVFLHHLINEAVGVVANASTSSAFTSFDENVVIAALANARKDIKKHFGVK